MHADIGPQHEILARCLAGSWNALVTLWAAPGQPPIQHEGQMHAEMTLGDRFLQQVYHSQGGFGDFHGRGLIGFNPGRGEFEYLWIDNTSTALQIESGRTEGDWRTLVLNGSTLFAGMTARIEHRSIFTIRSDDEHLYQRYVRQPGKNLHLQLEILYTRAP
ncbi:MAG: DUF1579 family protein [Phycisphaeraceae bacterium]|nr:DUF1579 family protein [Phycisphaeraceae bacterium]MCW5754581.1 DUF1579 family protein [Phycisphaeraceae bacterium]